MARKGLTLIEVVIAILVFSIGGLGLAASAAAVAKQISMSTLRSRAAVIARSRSEAALGGECTMVSSGASTTFGVRSTWSAAGGAIVTLDQKLERTDSRGTHSDRFLSAVPCD